jgi:hypothetical protein
MPMRSMKYLRMVLLAEVPVLLPALLLPAGLQSKELQSKETQSKETQSTVQRGLPWLPQEGQSVRQGCMDAGNSEPIRASKVGFSGNRAIPTCIEGACKEKPKREPDGHQGHLLSRLAVDRVGFLPCTCIATIPNPSQPQSKTER